MPERLCQLFGFSLANFACTAIIAKHSHFHTHMLNINTHYHACFDDPLSLHLLA